MGLFDHADSPFVSRWPHAIQTRIGIGKILANRAGANLFFGLANGVGKRQRILRRGPKQMKRQPLGRFLSDSGEVLQFIDESLNRRGKIWHL